MSDSVSIQSGKADISTSRFILATLWEVLKRAAISSERPSLKQSCTSTSMSAAFNPCALSGSSKASSAPSISQSTNVGSLRHRSKSECSNVPPIDMRTAMTLPSLPKSNPRKLIRLFRRLFLQFGSPPWKGFPGIPTAVLKVSYFSAHGSPVRQQNGSADHAPAQRWQPSLP